MKNRAEVSLSPKGFFLFSFFKHSVFCSYLCFPPSFPRLDPDGKDEIISPPFLPSFPGLNLRGEDGSDREDEEDGKDKKLRAA
jgi:hypothetical protein